MILNESAQNYKCAAEFSHPYAIFFLSESKCCTFFAPNFNFGRKLKIFPKAFKYLSYNVDVIVQLGMRVPPAGRCCR